MQRASRSRPEHHNLRFSGVVFALALGLGLRFWLPLERSRVAGSSAPLAADARTEEPSPRVARPAEAAHPACTAAAGCARAESSSHARQVRPRSEAPSAPSRTRPLSAVLEPRDGTAERLQGAWQNAVAECMRGRGLPYASAREAGVAADSNEALRLKMAPDERARWDHALMGEQTQPANPADEVALDVTESVGIRWPDRACATVADRKLYGDEAEYRNLQMQLTLVREQAHEAADRDPAYLAGMLAYARCMTKEGRTVAPSILSGEDALDEDADGTDAGCRAASGIMALREAARARAEQDAAERHKHDLAALEELHEGALATPYAEAD